MPLLTRQLSHRYIQSVKMFPGEAYFQGRGGGDGGSDPPGKVKKFKQPLWTNSDYAPNDYEY